MNNFDLIVIGTGAGMNVAADAINSDMRVAVIEHGPMGGTCLNNGCIPSKILLYPANVIRTLNDAASIGVKGNIANVDFQLIMGRMKSFVGEGRDEMERGHKMVENLKVFRQTGEFIGDYTMNVGNEKIMAPKIVIASGARILVPRHVDLVATVENTLKFGTMSSCLITRKMMELMKNSNNIMLILEWGLNEQLRF